MKKIYTQTNYGFTNSSEDKAEIGESLFDPESFAFPCLSGGQILCKKYILLLTRLRLEDPATVKYLIATNHHIVPKQASAPPAK